MQQEGVFFNFGIAELSAKISKDLVSPSKVYHELLQRILRLNPRINAFISILPFPEKLETGPLYGIPLAVKDIIRIQGVHCTAGSKILASDEPSKMDSTAVAKLKQAGATIIGTTNLHEFASGVTNNNPFFGPCRNPWDQSRISGGSSGGSAAAVSARLSFGALGTDTSGSVRIPAALCGVFGLKPTYGRISKYGVIPLADSLDHVGIFARSSLDCALILQEIAGHDPLDESSSAEALESFSSTLTQPIKGMKIGLPNTYFLEDVDSEVLESFETFCRNLSSLGATLEDISIANLEIVRETWAPIRMSEATAYHTNWLRTREKDYGADVLSLLKRGENYKAVDYILAQKNKRRITESFIAAFDRVDAMITPTVATTAPKIGASTVSLGNKKTYDVYSLLGKLTLPFNVTGLPALAIPSGLSREGLPMSVQLVGAPFKESTILQIAHNYESVFGTIPPPPAI